MMTRRQLIGRAVAAGALGGPLRVWAQTTAALSGGAEITTLSDGYLTLPESFLFGDLDMEKVNAAIRAAGIPKGGIEPPCNITLLRDSAHVVLFDAGAGPGFMPSAGKLPDALDAIGLAPDDVTHVIFTHGHPDHLWGVLDDFDEPSFPNAAHYMGAAELEYWRDPATLETIDAARQNMAAGAAQRLATLGERMQSFEDGDEVLPGVTARLTPGHTPGHMAFEIISGEDTVFVVGDAIGNGHIAFAHPDWQVPSDQDPPQGAETRMALMKKFAEENWPLIGFHLPAGGLGRVAAEGDAFRFTPAT